MVTLSRNDLEDLGWWEEHSYDAPVGIANLAVQSLCLGNTSPRPFKAYAVVTDEEAKEILQWARNMPEWNAEHPAIQEIADGRFNPGNAYSHLDHIFYCDRQGRMWVVDGPELEWELTPKQRPSRICHLPNDCKCVPRSKLRKRVRMVLTKIDE